MSFTDRRAFLTGAVAVLAATSVAAATLKVAKPARPAPAALSGFVDVHHHLFPPAMVAALEPRLPKASLPGVQKSIAELNAGGTETALISFPSPDLVTLEEPRLTRLVRGCNSFATGLTHSYPGRYGLFASLPLPHLDASLKEIEFAFDQLHAAGILLLSNYNNKWLGDPWFAPLLAELNRRKALVFVHPAVAGCCKGLVPGVTDGLIEEVTDTTRTIASLVLSGAAQTYPDIRFIFSHAGGTLPAVIERFPKDAAALLKSFYYDTAQAASPAALGALLSFIPPQQILFGSDFPARGAREQAAAVQSLGLKPPALKGILSENARRLLGGP
jgi:6-methylsalicylate decarboxylase